VILLIHKFIFLQIYEALIVVEIWGWWGGYVTTYAGIHPKNHEEYLLM